MRAQPPMALATYAVVSIAVKYVVVRLRWQFTPSSAERGPALHLQSQLPVRSQLRYFPHPLARDCRIAMIARLSTALSMEVTSFFATLIYQDTISPQSPGATSQTVFQRATHMCHPAPVNALPWNTTLKHPLMLVA